MIHAVTKLGFERIDYTLTEGFFTTICLTFDMDLEKPISVNFSMDSITPFCEPNPSYYIPKDAKIDFDVFDFL